ncbi:MULTISPECIES: IclR family transcriptional regulator [unclassified Variovorax]|uniref:IclR family transcriptional regulator n=1 Tax=unclassified Variovorax TaxID=663243 RepID=UPI001BD2419C|nr:MULTISPECIES: IclR family transcriptional regulator [unclassified Variovorax]
MTSPARVLAILNLFTEERAVWHTDDINEAMGYTRATGYRYVKDLVEAGFLQKVSGGRYSLGARIIELDYRLRRSDPVLLAAVPVMDEMARKARMDAVLTTMFGMKIIDIYRASADSSLQLGYGRGRPRPLFAGASPKVILSCTPRPQLVKIYEANAAEARKHGLGSSWTDFRAYLSNVRKQGFYWSMGELEEAVGGMAVPLLNEDGEALAALALVGTHEVLLAMGEARMRAMLARASDEIGKRLADGVQPPGANMA